jgi:hypothetical protein
MTIIANTTNIKTPSNTQPTNVPSTTEMRDATKYTVG